MGDPRARPAQATGWARRPVAGAVLLALAAWGGSVVRGGFSFDDREAILDNPVVAGGLPWTEAFGRDYWHHRGDAGHYRPLATLSLALDHALWGERPWGYHLTNALLHAALVAVAGWILVALGTDRRAILLGLGLFAAHPALADSVAWISGRTSMVACLGGALALAATLRLRDRPRALLLASGGALLLGLLGKEDAVVFALPSLAVALAAGRRAALASLLGLALALSAYGALRWGALGAVLPSAPHAPLAAAGLLERLHFAGRALLEGLALVAVPLDHPPNYRGVPGFHPGDPPAPWAWLGWLPWLAALGLGGRALLARRTRGPAAAACVLAALSLVPVLQLLPAGEIFAPRFLYLPLLISTPLLGRLSLRLGRPGRPAAALLAALLVALAWGRAGVYASRGSYARATLVHAPGDAGAWNDLGIALEEQGDRDRAAASYRRAVELDPGASRAWSNLGGMAVAAGDLGRAEDILRRAVATGGGNAIARCNLASVLLRRGRPREAASLYREATAIAPGMHEAWRGLGNALSGAGREDGARQALERALALWPGDPAARRLLERLDRRR